MQYRREYDMKLIGGNLRYLRRAKKLTVDEVRKYLCQASVQTLYKYEAGKCYPSVDVLLALMQLYEADLYDILCEAEHRPVFEPRYMTKTQQIKRLKCCLKIYRDYKNYCSHQQFAKSCQNQTLDANSKDKKQNWQSKAV